MVVVPALYSRVLTAMHLLTFSAKEGFFCQSYEDQDILDSAVLIMPLVFFTSGKFIGGSRWL
jgi:hypothetical protein